MYADFITTVSENYAKEVLTPEGGRGLEGILKRYKDKFCGIINGIDYTYWNSETDRFIQHKFSRADSETILVNKKKTRNLFFKNLE